MGATILLKRTEVYQVSDEAMAIDMISQARTDSLTADYILTKSSYVIKEKKSKGEIIDRYAVVTLEKTFNN